MNLIARVSAYLHVMEPSPFRTRLAELLMVARASQYDLYGRASFLEGVLRKPTGSMTRGNVIGQLEDARSEVPSSFFRNEREEEKFFSLSIGWGIEDAVLQGARAAGRKAPAWLGDSGRLNADEIFQELSSGYNLATLTKAKNGPIYRRTGLYMGRKKGVTVQGIWSSIKDDSYDQAMALIKRRAPDLRGDQPVGEKGSPTYLQQMADKWTVDSGSDAGAAIAAGGLQLVDSYMQKKLSGPQLMVWEAVLAAPSMVITTTEPLGIKANALAKAIKAIHGKDISGSVASRQFKRFVLPALMEGFNQRGVLRELRRDQEILEVIQEDTHRRRAAMAVRISHRFACGGDCPCAPCQENRQEETAVQVIYDEEAMAKNIVKRMEAPPPRRGPGGT